MSSTLNQTTLDPGSVHSVASVQRVIALTIVAHPDLARVGQRALLSQLAARETVRLSRVEPEFRGATGEPQPLRDAYLSRDAVALSVDPGGLRVDCRQTSMSISVDGEGVTGATWIELERLGRGVAIDLAGRVVLWVHYTQLFSPPDSAHAAILGVSDAVSFLLAEIRSAASHVAPVLLRGESGSGKELVARAIHDASQRASGPYVSVNVAAIPPTTASAELFGYKKGAFTGATESHSGWFGRADGGSLFLDEIGETPDVVQPMLLRVLETGEVQPVGGQGARQVDVRVITATDADLAAAANAGGFRFPLLQRLGGHVIFVPPLRERLADFGILLVHFLRRELGALGQTPPDSESSKTSWLPSEVVVRALRYEWPGNVRELANFARELVFSSRGKPVLGIGRTFDALLPTLEARRESKPQANATAPVDRQAIGDELLVETLRANRWQVGATARALGIAKNTLYQLMERCEGIRKARDLGREEILECRESSGGDAKLMAERLEVSERGLKLRMRELEID